MNRSPLLVLMLAVAGCAASPAPASPPAAPASFSVAVVGAGPPMVLIPGLACPGEVWQGAVARWSGRYRMHVITIAGFAGQPPAGVTPLLDTVRRDLVRYLERQRLDAAVIVGHSLGGFLAWWLAATAPERVAAVVAVEGVPFLSDLFSPGATADSARPQARMLQAMMAGMSRQQFAAHNRAQLASMITDPVEVDRLSGPGGQSDPVVVGAAVHEMMTTDLREVVAAVRAPSLLIVGGAFDPAAARVAAERQLARVPRHQVVVVDGARHFVMLDQPSAFFAAVDGFLARSQAGAAR
jgi:N-formylmaleamate deformylase